MREGCQSIIKRMPVLCMKGPIKSNAIPVSIGLKL